MSPVPPNDIPTGGPRAPSLQSVVEELADLRAELNHLRAERPDRDREPAVRAGDDGSTSARRRIGRRRIAATPSSEPSGLVSRRRLFGLLGGAAAAGAGLAVAGSALGPDPAGAADGGSLLIGVTNSNTSGSTVLGGSTTGGNTMLRVTQAETGSGSDAIVAVHSGNANAAVGVWAASTGSGSGTIGVHGQCNGAGTGNVGVHGRCNSDGGTAVVGEGGATNVIGVAGYSDYAGVQGQSFTGNAVAALAPLSGSNGAHLFLAPSGIAGAPTGTHQQGQFWMDSTGILFQCVTSGSPGKWVRQSPLVTIAPARVYDSRVGQLPATPPKSPITNGATVNVDVTGTQAAGGLSGVPAGASGVLGNITVILPSGGVALTVFGEGQTQPSTSNINASVGGIVANNFTSQVGTSNGISIFGSGGPTDFVIDIFGYYL